MEKRLLAAMPQSVEDAIKTNDIKHGKPLVFAFADMDLNCNFKDSILLLCEDCLIYGCSKSLCEEHS